MAVVILLSPLAGYEFSLAPGDAYECPEETAERLVAAGLAVRKNASEKEDTKAEKSPVFPRGRGRGKKA